MGDVFEERAVATIAAALRQAHEAGEAKAEEAWAAADRWKADCERLQAEVSQLKQRLAVAQARLREDRL